MEELLLNLERKIQSTHFLDLEEQVIGSEQIEGLAKLLENSEVTHLNLAFSFIPNQSLCGIPVSRIIYLNLRGNCISDSGVIPLAEKLPSSAITELDLEKNYISSEGVTAIAQKLSSCSLSILKLGMNSISDYGAQELAKALEYSQLTELHLQGNLIGDKGGELLYRSIPSSKLVTLSLYWNPMTDHSALFESVAHTQISTIILDTSGAKLSSRIVRSCLIESNVTVLSLGNSFSNLVHVKNSFSYLAESKLGIDNSLDFMVAQTKLRELYLGSLALDKRFAVLLAKELPDSQLTHLSLRYNPIENEGVKCIAENIPGSEIEYLDLCGTRLSSAKDIAKVLPNSKLTYLDLSENNLRNEGAKAIAKQASLSKVTKLYLDSNSINKKGLKALANGLGKLNIKELSIKKTLAPENGKPQKAVELIALQLPNWETSFLDLSFTRIIDQDINSLCRSIPISSLKFLNLEGNPIKDAGIKSLAKVIPSSKFESLVLSNLSFQMGVAEVTFAVFACPSMRHLDLSFNDINYISAEKAQQLVQENGLSYLENPVLQPPENSEGIHLNLSHCTNGFALGIVLRMISSRLRSVDLSSTQTQSSNLKEFLHVLPDSQITSLSLCFSSKELETILPRTKLVSLSVYAQGYSLRPNLPSTISYLHLNNFFFGADTFFDFVHSLPNTQITFLKLNLCGIDSNYAIELSKVIPETQLLYLDLNNNRIGYGGVIALTRILSASKLLGLCLKENNLGEIAGFLLVNAWQNSKLEILKANWKMQLFGGYEEGEEIWKTVVGKINISKFSNEVIYLSNPIY